MAKQVNEFDGTMVPTEIGERIQVMARGGNITLGMVGKSGHVGRFNRNGFPVIELDGCQIGERSQATDRYGCARCVDQYGHWVRPPH